MMLKVDGLTVAYGKIPAVRKVSFDVGDGETLAVLGANGAGKSTLTLAVAGAMKPQSGQVRFLGQDIVGKPSEDIARLGISLVPEGRHIISGLSVAENLALGVAAASSKREARKRIEHFYDRFPILAERRSGLATQLSGGEQQQLAIARALVSGPRLLILDEPSLGLAPVVVDQVYALLAELRSSGLTILLVEQNPGRAEAIADRVAIMGGGEIREILTGAELAARDDGENYAFME